MKSCILSLSIMIMCCAASMAQHCKFDYEKKDPFTGKMTKGNTATIDKTWKLGFNKAGEDYTLGIFVNFNGVREDKIHAGDTLMFAIDGGDPVILISIADGKPTSNVYGNIIETYYQAQYKMSQADVLKMSQKASTAIRVYFGTVTAQLDIPSKNSGKIQKAATCILE